MQIVNRFATEEECSRFSEFLAWLTFRGRRLNRPVLSFGLAGPDHLVPTKFQQPV